MTERVADYPRPPLLEREPRELRIVLGGEVVAATTDGWRVKETFHPPTYYLPRDAFAPGALVQVAGGSLCEWKGRAVYWSVRGGGRAAVRAGWSYPDPTAAFAAIADHVAVYAGPMDGCFVGGERVIPQPGGFYGGWITADLIGPFKGEPGTEGW
jgi:uncharacterized protein (DUF427 family)